MVGEGVAVDVPQQCLNFLPLPQGQEIFRPILAVRIVVVVFFRSGNFIRKKKAPPEGGAFCVRALKSCGGVKKPRDLKRLDPVRITWWAQEWQFDQHED